MKLLLGSQSPRRQRLLAGLGVPFECHSIETEERFPAHLRGEEIPIYLAQLKAKAYWNLLDDETLLITADTIVWLDNKVLGKPANLEDARQMLHTLSGKTHQVITGVCLTTRQVSKRFSVTTEVTFSQLNDCEIDYYIDNYRPLDKAGAYGIQEWIGFVGVEKIVGSYFNVMGLPVQRLYRELEAFGGLDVFRYSTAATR